jgi:hypothetical protein
MKLIATSIIILVLAACTPKEDMTPLKPIDTAVSIAAARKPSPVSLRPVEFRVITKETQSTLENERVWYAITVKSYENLAFNTQEMLRVIREQKAAINYYEGLILEPK